MSLVAREIEGSGTATVVIGSARDIVEECGVSRFVFTDLPLGNPIGPPHDVEGQRSTVELALAVAATARHPRTTVQSPLQWVDDAWRESYMRVDDSNREALLAAGQERRAEQARRRS